MKEVMDYTGWSDNVVRRLFAYDKDFPAIKIGKKYQVTLVGLTSYLSTRHVPKEN